MTRLVLSLIVFALAAAAGHIFVLKKTPSVIMNKAMTAMDQRGVETHGFTLSPRLTPQTQTVVRPSPDLAYSICLYDFSQGGILHVSAAAYDNYASISFFDSETNNFATLRVGKNEDNAGKTFRLYPPTHRIPPNFKIADDPMRIDAPTSRGIILIRRLAPRLTDYERVVSIASTDQCRLETA